MSGFNTGNHLDEKVRITFTRILFIVWHLYYRHGADRLVGPSETVPTHAECTEETVVKRQTEWQFGALMLNFTCWVTWRDQGRLTESECKFQFVKLRVTLTFTSTPPIYLVWDYSDQRSEKDGIEVDFLWVDIKKRSRNSCDFEIRSVGFVVNIFSLHYCIPIIIATVHTFWEILFSA